MHRAVRMSSHDRFSGQVDRPLVAKTIRLLSIPIILVWLVLAGAAAILVPTLESVSQANAPMLVPSDAPSTQGMAHIGEIMGETASTTIAMVVLEGQHPLGQAEHRYYDTLVQALEQDKAQIAYVMDLWGKPVTAAGNQSADGKAAYVLVRLAGNIGEAKANESVDALRDIVTRSSPPDGLKTYVAGPGPLASDTLRSADESMATMTLVTVAVISVIMVVVYRSLLTALLPLLTVGLELLSAKGFVALLADHHIIGISSFATNTLVSLVLGAGTDYAIFLIGRYQEARRAGEDPQDAYYSMFSGVSHVILGSGVAIAGAVGCLSFTRLNFFQTMGVPCAVGMIVAVTGALTLGPALITVGSRFGLFEPKGKGNVRLWRRIGTSVVRWPKPILAVSSLLVAIGAVMLPAYKVGYNDRDYQPPNTSSNQGFGAADRHFPVGKLNSEMILVESDHDMRNPADMLSVDKVAASIFRVPGVSMVQAVTRPLGHPLEHASFPFALGTSQGALIGRNLQLLKDRVADLDTITKILGHTIGLLERMQELTDQQAHAAHIAKGGAQELQEVTEALNADFGEFDDFFRPVRNYFYWEPHCADIPVCWSSRSVFEALDQVDSMVTATEHTLQAAAIQDAITPQMTQLMGLMTTDLRAMQGMLLGVQSTLQALIPQMEISVQDQLDMGQSFDKSRKDDMFFLPREAFDNPDFQIDLRYFMSGDGKAARYIVYHDGEALSAEGLDHVPQIEAAVRQALKGSSIATAKVYAGGAAATYKDIRAGAAVDFLVAAVAAFSLVFLIMLIITRSLAAAAVIIGTVAFSFAGAFGLSVLIWEHIIGIKLHWLVLPLAFTILVAVGSDYNMLLISRVKDEIRAGINTGIIRSVAHTGGVVTTAGLVFAFTMLAMVASDVKIIGQFGSTVCIGLLLDTLVVRSFIVPALARLLGPWFWWPQIVRSRPAVHHGTSGSTP